ncbi:NmrA-like family protein [Ilyonectria robusta]|uniref:NmrA-like family protein n=1 Tax=Ilyonectria robusta TaxID=1079257 RepID=UPI001E8D5B08|nr:NmrA-like family protein [Ilyonectria robusta]KAH8714149.1 NmrA-like family protein [Ilyonectria robusta]
MSAINKVVLIGKGFLGSAILEQLIDGGFAVTVFTRDKKSIQGVPAGAEVAEVDYASAASLENALRGQDVAISTVAGHALGGQKLIIDACIKAGVKRYIPCDWGSLSTDPVAKQLAVYAPQVATQEYLREKAELGELEYTIIATGVFLDLVFMTPTLVDFEAHTALIYDNGIHPFSTSSLASIGKAVVGALKKAKDTKNSVLYIHDTVLTQAKFMALLKKHSPKGVEWTETAVDAEAELQRSTKAIQESGMDMFNMIGQLKAAFLGGKYGAAYKRVDNELLGLGLLDDEGLEAKVIAKLGN